MANIKISELNEKTTVGLNDLFPIVDATTNETKKITGANLVSNEYSTNETKTNMKWIDGKPIYRMVLNIPQLPIPENEYGYTYSPYITNITTLDNLINIYGVYKSSDRRMFPINAPHIVHDYGVDADISTWTSYLTGTLKVIVMVNKILTLTSGYVILEYTKTTD